MTRLFSKRHFQNCIADAVATNEQCGKPFGPVMLIIFGKKRQVPERGEKIFYVDWVPDEIFQSVYLPAQVVPERATAKLHAGVLELTLPRKERGTKRTP